MPPREHSNSNSNNSSNSRPPNRSPTMKQPPAPKYNIIEATKPQPVEAETSAAKPPLNITMRVAEKGGLSVYGLQRMPITLYAEQWINVLDLKDEILAFIERERDRLAWKETK